MKQISSILLSCCIVLACSDSGTGTVGDNSLTDPVVNEPSVPNSPETNAPSQNVQEPSAENTDEGTNAAGGLPETGESDDQANGEVVDQQASEDTVDQDDNSEASDTTDQNNNSEATETENQTTDSEADETLDQGSDSEGSGPDVSDSDGSEDADETPPPIETDDQIDDTPDTTGEEQSSAPRNATYRVTFDAGWTAATHPAQFPGESAHFSGLVGSVHSEQVIFWEPGQIATDGIELMAETGSKEIFISEINFAIDEGSATALIDGPGIATGDGSGSVEIIVSIDYPQLTITTMLAPSPDWFAGLHNFNLFVDGEFINDTQIDARLYDAGTDSGVSFTSGDDDTDPRETITLLSSDPADSDFSNGEPFVGRFIIERLN